MNDPGFRVTAAGEPLRTFWNAEDALRYAVDIAVGKDNPYAPGTTPLAVEKYDGAQNKWITLYEDRREW